VGGVDPLDAENVNYFPSVLEALDDSHRQPRRFVNGKTV